MSRVVGHHRHRDVQDENEIVLGQHRLILARKKLQNGRTSTMFIVRWIAYRRSLCHGHPHLV